MKMLKVILMVLAIAMPFIPFASLNAATCERTSFANQPDKFAESAYNHIFIYTAEPCVKMTFRRVGMEFDESMINKADIKELPIFYTQMLTVAVAYPDEIRKVAMLGVGGGSTLNYLSAYLEKTNLLGVELDPKVLEFAKADFALSKKLAFIEADGRLFLVRTKEQFDLIILDAFRGGYIPSHMLTREFYQLLRTRLSPTGVVSINLHSGSALFDSALKTIRSVFPTVDIYPAGGNVVVVASNRLVKRNDLNVRAQKRQMEFGFRYPIPAMLAMRRDYSIPEQTELLTDDFSPVNQLDQIRSINAPRW